MTGPPPTIDTSLLLIPPKKYSVRDWCLLDLDFDKFSEISYSSGLIDESFEIFFSSLYSMFM
jgi:hypothetical protein